MKRELTTTKDQMTLPTLADLDEGQKRTVFKDAVRVKLRREMEQQITALSESVDELLADFLRTRKSDQTRVRYRNGIKRWLTWCESAGVHPLLATAKDADLFAAQLTGAPASVNSTISGVSSWYSTLYKWGKIARTPFVKIARRAETTGEHRVPSAAEIRTILEAAK